MNKIEIRQLIVPIRGVDGVEGLGLGSSPPPFMSNEYTYAFGEWQKSS